ncbi:MAG: histidine kinase [Chloroflexi bacterium]|nr:histidine kinase [Chloroflexota bacterium]
MTAPHRSDPPRLQGPSSRLRTRLLVSHLIVAVAALGTVLLAVSLVGPGYFAEAMGHGPGEPGGAIMDEITLAAFQDAVRTALVAGFLIALATAVAIAVALSGRVADPITRMAAAALRISTGHYAERVPAAGTGEVRELADTFNAMAASLEDTERRRLELVGDVAHELRTPLATLDGYLEGIEDGVVAPRDETWALLRRETARLTRLVDDLSQLWRAEARQLPLTLAVVDLAVVAAETAEHLRAVAADRRIEIRIAVAPHFMAVGDRDRVAQVIGNYLSNALRYAPEGSTVEVVARDGDEAWIGVRDEGPGLTVEQRTRVFERFYRIDASRSRALGGSGIGLPIARALADAMGGRAWAESAGPGLGSTFWLALPRSGWS